MDNALWVWIGAGHKLGLVLRVANCEMIAGKGSAYGYLRLAWWLRRKRGLVIKATSSELSIRSFAT